MKGDTVILRPHFILPNNDMISLNPRKLDSPRVTDRPRAHTEATEPAIKIKVSNYKDNDPDPTQAALSAMFHKHCKGHMHLRTVIVERYKTFQGSIYVTHFFCPLLPLSHSATRAFGYGHDLQRKHLARLVTCGEALQCT